MRATLRAGLSLIAMTLASQPVVTQPASPLTDVEWLVGRWEGGGWSEFIPGRREAFRSTEIVESRLDGSSFVIEGNHWTDGADGTSRKIHHALAIVTPGSDGKLDFRSYVIGRGGGNFTAWVEGGVFFWEIPRPNATLRYQISQDDEGRWFERGMLGIDGQEPRQIFEMVLERVP